jgi:hypothetical protein
MVVIFLELKSTRGTRALALIVIASAARQSQIAIDSNYEIASSFLLAMTNENY